jgi:hypothetical protein
MNSKKNLAGAILASLAFCIAPNIALAQRVNTPTFTRRIDSRATFINADGGANLPLILDLRRLGINPGDTIVLERFGYFSPFGDVNNEYFGAMYATFSTSSQLLPNSGFFSGANTNRIPGAINAEFPNGCSPIKCDGKLFFISRGQNLVQNGFNGILVRVPANAQFLFIAAGDSRYDDNVDSNQDLAVGISKVVGQN